MHRLYTETFQYQSERHQALSKGQKSEHLNLSDGRWFEVRQWIDRAGEWLVDQLAVLGQNLPCLDNELACDLNLSA
jgi:hypothetical protein